MFIVFEGNFLFQYYTRGNLKYYLLNKCKHLFYMTKIGVQRSLSLDTDDISKIQRRLEGYEYLRETLCAVHSRLEDNKITDCRFKKVKTLVPLLKDLEHPIPNSFESYDGINVKLHDGTLQKYLGNNAIHFFGPAFYREIDADVYNAQKDCLNHLTFTNITSQMTTNVNTLTELTKMEEVRYALSGSEAVDIAFRDVRTSTEKKYIVRFKNAYHGHSSGVANDGPHMLYLNEMTQEALDFIETYHYRIAGVVVNPMHYFYGPNKVSPPGEKLTVGRRSPSPPDFNEYSAWLNKLNDKCKYCSAYLTPIAFIMDDIYFGFRTQEIFSYKFFNLNTEPDVIILGKGMAGGYPLSAVCGKARFMNFYDKNYLLKVNRSVGTFTAWERGICASNVFLSKILSNLEMFTPPIERFDNFVLKTNRALCENKIPVQLRNFSNTFSVDYLEDSLYNSMFTQFLMAEGIFFSNQSTGKFNLSAGWSEDDLDDLMTKIVDAGVKMKEYQLFEPKDNKYWYLPFSFMFATNWLRINYDQIMLDKKIDIEVSHNHPFNKFGHFWSSIGMIFISYPAMWNGNYSKGVAWFLYTHTLRQSGHFFYERQDPDQEKRKFGHKDGTKKVATLGVGLCIMLYLFKDNIQHFKVYDKGTIALYSALMTVLPHFTEIWHKYSFVRAIQWAIKIITDPFTDLGDFYTHAIIHPKYFIDFNVKR